MRSSKSTPRKASCSLASEPTGIFWPGRQGNPKDMGRAMNASLHSLRAIARALGGYVSGANVRCPAPGHSAKDDSLSVRISPGSPDGFVVYPHAGDDWQACRDHVKTRLGLSRFKPGSSPEDHAAKGVETRRRNAREPSRTRTAALAPSARTAPNTCRGVFEKPAPRPA